MKKEPKVKQVLLTVGNVRVKEYDSMNVVIERYEEVYNPIEKETNMRWRFKGYSSDVLKALLSIQRKELLIDHEAISDLESYLNQVDESNEKLIRILGESS